jgi:hypothetical protein
MSREWIDRNLNKWVSRKLIVFLTATVGLFSGKITDDNWIIIAVAYISIEGVTNIVERLKNK